MNLLFVMNPVAGGWSPLDSGGWGGGEETCVLFTRAFTAAGHSVTVAWDGPALADLPVPFLPYTDERVTKGTWDAVLYFKCPEFALNGITAPLMALWTDQERPFNADPFHRIVVPSEYLKRCLASAMPRAEEKLAVIPYGYDPDELAADVTRDPRLVLHASSPDRGLETFLRLWPEVRKARPEAKLQIVYGWDLFLKYGGDPELKRRVEDALARLPRSSWWMGRVPRKDLAATYRKAGVWVYYCTGGEQFGLTAIKAQVCGAVPVVKPWGALHETVFSGIKADTESAFVAGLIDALDPERQAHLRDGIDSTRAATWTQVAELWAMLLEQPTTVEVTSRVGVVPGTPILAPEPGFRFPALFPDVVTSWAQDVKPQRVWADPALHGVRSAVPEARSADAVLLAWTLEDDPRDVERILRSWKLQPGTAVCTMTSYGPWRAEARHRVFARADLVALFGRLPEFLVRAVPTDNAGSGIHVCCFRWEPKALGTRDLARVVRTAAPRETLSIVFMVRDAEPVFLRTLGSVARAADEIVVVDTGSRDGTLDVVERFRKKSGLEVRIATGTSPRWCYDCLREHALGELQPGHRVAGFETPRNESIALARGDWQLWLDADEELIEASPASLDKYLRPNMFAGYSIPQYHHSTEPGNPGKTDYPVRLFRRTPDPEVPSGLFPFGPLAWPTMGTGQKARFTGIVHEHPGFPPDYTAGLGPAIVLSDVMIAHAGYYVEERRRRRFVRNWPLMVADRQKYPDRRLGEFLWIRDLFHHARYLVEQMGNRLSPESASYCEEICRLYESHFLASADAFSQECLGYYSAAMQMLRRGFEFTVSIKAKKPECSGDELAAFDLAGRVPDWDGLMRLLTSRAGEVERWSGNYL